MNIMLNRRKIKLLCGSHFYEQGEHAYYSGNVGITLSDAGKGQFRAVVKDGTKNRYDVEVNLETSGDVSASCTCPDFPVQDYYCKHIAAALIQIIHLQEEGTVEVRSYPSLLHKPDLEIPDGYMTPRYQRARTSEQAEKERAEDILSLFSKGSRISVEAASTILETRERLSVQFTVRSIPYGYHKQMLGLEIKIGPKRLYIVQQVKQFLSRLARKESHVFSKHFTYDPEVHCFRSQDYAVLAELIHLERQEEMYLESLGGYPGMGRAKNQDRMLLIPPLAWEKIAPLLSEAADVHVQQEDEIYSSFTLPNRTLPLDFEFSKHSENSGFQLEIPGLQNMLILKEYSLVLHDGIFYKVPEESAHHLAGLKDKLLSSRAPVLGITAEQMGPYMEKVVPGLMRLGRVHLTEEISSQMVQVPLKARLYLDRVRDKLLAGLEFQYGDVVINPLEEKERLPLGRIMIRDKAQEEQIIRLMENSGFARTEAGYYLENEDAEFDFLFYTMPQLEQLVEVLATSAVKIRILTSPVVPLIRAHWDERTDWLEFTFDIKGIPDDEIKEVLTSVEARRKYHRLQNGALLPLSSSKFQEMVKLINEMGFRKGDLSRGEGKLPTHRGLSLMDKQSEQLEISEALQQFLVDLAHPEKMEFPVPSSLHAELRDYQKTGYRWMKMLASYRFGGILADDMGLGKTLQSITFILSEIPVMREHKMPALIVSPASLVYNWHNELKKFAPELRTVIADGSKGERGEAISQMDEVDVVITSYPLLRRDSDLYAKQQFHILILDEAQAFKNHSTQTAQSVKQISARHRFALTGTPIENSQEELWSIYDAVFPELFAGRKAFQELSRESIAKRIRPFLLRRVKSDVLQELPDKIESLQVSELLPEQKKLYIAYLAKLRQETVKHLNEEGFQKNRIKILAGLTRLRQLCCHPGLFVEGYTGSSAKFEQLMELIEESRSAGKRILLFSQFTEMLGIIGRELGLQGMPFFYLDGQTPGQERVELCERFNEGERDLFLISLKAGGTGLNLTGADTVILYDLWWNPAVEDQAASRAHRMGQKNVVQVIRLVTQGTVEDKMYELQQRKKNLIEEIIQPGQEAISPLSEHEIREILAI
ncbi:DEAD/DEAH box helicase [Paenibacillus sp. Marseille-Q4541]|uniref:DEAD/DEAH box helicase n=1 Tax=Paenibacillus sp. Marseille-Q4541 TaxID=2831522 RepID=UPI001BAD8003|nr:DEAD/DEAH box helicase [Paenibacillus sp. Marseille-Q4541]